MVRPLPLSLLALALGSGCVRHVTITSDPLGASVYRGHQALGPTPVDLELVWVPLLSQPVRVAVAGYRGVKVPLGRHLGLLRHKTTHEVILIRAHGPSGTWGPDDAGK